MAETAPPKRRLKWNEKPKKERSRARLFETPDNPVPPGGHAYSLLSEDRMRIRVAIWEPEGPARGTIVLLPGRTETIEKYFEVVAELLARRFAVMTIDWRGQGASTRPLNDSLKGHVGDFAEFLSDLRLLLNTVGKTLPEPRILLGHSMGGNIALQALHDYPRHFAGAVLSAPMMGIKVRQPRLVRLIARFAPRTAYVPGGERFDPLTEAFEANLVTHDRRRFLRNRTILQENPTLALGSPTWGWLKAAFRAVDRVQQRGYLEALAVPVLVLSAAEEALVDNAAQATGTHRLPRGRLQVIPAARHELLQETDAVRHAFWQAFDGFAADVAPTV